MFVQGKLKEVKQEAWHDFSFEEKPVCVLYIAEIAQEHFVLVEGLPCNAA